MKAESDTFEPRREQAFLAILVHGGHHALPRGTSSQQWQAALCCTVFMYVQSHNLSQCKKDACISIQGELVATARAAQAGCHTRAASCIPALCQHAASETSLLRPLVAAATQVHAETQQPICMMMTAVVGSEQVRGGSCRAPTYVASCSRPCHGIWPADVCSPS